MEYVSLHGHSTYSYMDGFALPKHHVDRIADLGMSAIALTEHGNVSSHVKLENAAKEAGVKPIFGLEAYLGPNDMRETANMRKWHMTMLAMNKQGLENLYALVTRSWDEGFYRWPTIQFHMLKEAHEGIIMTSGCADGKIACDLLGGKGNDKPDERKALKTAMAFKRLLGDRFYLEVQRFPELERTRLINTKYEEWAKRYGFQLLATSDVHYPYPDQNEMQKILHAAGRNTGTVAAAEASWEYNILLTYPMSDKQIYDDLRATGLSDWGAREAIRNTAIVAERCNVDIPKMDRLRYPLEQEEIYRPGMTSEDMIRAWLNDGWKFRGFDKKLSKAQKKEYKERVEYELDLMKSKDFLDYFLMMSDVVRAVKDNELPVGPARGSAAASLVCYLLRITEVNPMEYPLMLFERFMDPNRMDMPDIDLDFDDERRDEARQHMIMRYGEDRVGNIGTFTKYKGKNSVDDVARVFQIPKFEVDKVKNFIVERSGGDARFDASLEDTVEMFPQVKEVFEKYPDLYKSIQLEGNYKGFGVHAAGIVVGADRLDNYVAMYTKHNVGANKTSLKVLSVDKYDGEPMGLLKLDALGLSTMTMLRYCLEFIGKPLSFLYDIPLDDPETLKAFEAGDVTGIFQFEGRTMKIVTQELKPATFMDLAAVNALARPGPLHSGSTGDYIAIRHGRMEYESLHPVIDRICAATEGQIIYQEQILQICGEVGRLPWTHRSAIRRVISQRKGEQAFNRLKDEFMKGAAEGGFEEDTADQIWKKMVTAGTYAFNIAHCISYSMLGFWAMYFKVHHPLEFYAAQLRKTPIDDKGKALALMRDMSDHRFGRSFKVLPPDPQTSEATWMPAENGVLAGFGQIKGIGDSMSKTIIEHREALRNAGGELEDWNDLLAVRGIGPKKIEMIREFTDDEDPFGIEKLVRAKRAIIKDIDNLNIMAPMPNWTSDTIPYDNTVNESGVILASLYNRNLQEMFENHRSRAGEELDPSTVRDPHLNEYMTLYLEDETGPITAKISRWLYPKVKDEIWSATLHHDFILAKVKKMPFAGKSVHIEKLWVIDPD